MTDTDQNLVKTLIAYVSAMPSPDALVLEVLKTSMTGFALYRGPSLRLRRAYLASLEEPQEWFLEELVGSGSVWLHEDGSYAITHHDTLVEFSSASHDFGAKRLRLSTLGLMQFLVPTMLFLISIFVFQEPLYEVQLYAFVMIWTALAIYAWSIINEDSNQKSN